MNPKSRISVGLVSDTHGWLNPDLKEAFARCVCIVHAGDVGKVEVLDELEDVAPVHAVKGNIDGGELRFLPLERVDEVGGKRIAVLHIAGDPMRPNRAARDLIRRERPDVIVVGHTHVPVVGRVDGTLWINPGAAGRQGHHDMSFAAILHIEESGDLALDRIHLGPR